MSRAWKIFIFILLVNYSYERSINEWTRTNDGLLIDECLKKSLQHINLRQYIIKKTITDVKNIFCQTRINNGISIKLTFMLEDQTWQCILYQSIEQTFNIEYERCNRIEIEYQRCDRIEKENQLEQIINKATIDEINQNKQEKSNINQETNNQQQDRKQVINNKPDNQQPFDMHANRNSDEE